MADREILMNWLSIALQQPAESFSELFYYDRRDDQFFSILLTDYFLFDDELNFMEDTSSTYSKKELFTLQDRMQRIESKDPSVIVFPRLGKQDDFDLAKNVNTFLKTHDVNLKTVTIWATCDDGTITINLD